MKYTSFLYKIYHWVARIPPKISLQTKDPLSTAERIEIIKLMSKGYYVILTGNKYHLSSILVKVITFLKTGKYPRYSHALMNCDFLEKPEQVDDFKFMEATVAGVHYSKFDQAFDCDTVCILSPKNISNKEWTKIIDGLVKQKGRPYDDLYNLSDTTRVSCVELVLNALKEDPKYSDKFVALENMITSEGNLLPFMFRECEDFEVIYENK